MTLDVVRRDLSKYFKESISTKKDIHEIRRSQETGQNQVVKVLVKLDRMFMPMGKSHTYEEFEQYKMIIDEIITKKNGWQICRDTPPPDNTSNSLFAKNLFPRCGSTHKISP